jgi:hypothetical protein
VAGQPATAHIRDPRNCQVANRFGTIYTTQKRFAPAQIAAEVVVWQQICPLSWIVFIIHHLEIHQVALLTGYHRHKR